MRIPTLTVSEHALDQIQKLGARQVRLQAQVATGQRIFLPEDDPAAMGRLLGAETERRQLQQFQRNATTALEVSQASFSGLNEIKKLSDRASELATLGRGALSPAATSAYAAEVNQLIEQAWQVGNTRFRNDYLFAGTAVDAPPFTATRNGAGEITGVAYAGNGDRTEIKLAEGSTLAPGTSGAINTGIRDFIEELIALRDALATGTAADVAAVQPGLEASENLLINAIAEQGAVQLRIEVSQNQQRARLENVEQLLSSEADIDLPSAIVRLNQATTAYQAALQSSAGFMQLSLLDYLR